MDSPQRFDVNAEYGLSDEQVLQREKEGLTNNYNSTKTRTYKQILYHNFVTFFNILNGVLAILVSLTGSIKDLSFAIIIVLNLIIGLVQEIHSKRTLDKLSLIVVAKVFVVRNGEKRKISVKDVVLDDIMILKAGNQICADGTVKSGVLEVNESNITGESDIIIKKEGDKVFSGSFVVAGSARVLAEKVGEESYANKISSDAKKAVKKNSELRNSLNSILKFVSVIVVPIGIIMFITQMGRGLAPDENIVKAAASVISMIPEGLILMTSISLGTSAVILAYKQTLVQELYAIENLARVNVLCLDKTGTITEGKMTVEDIVDFDKCENLREILGEFCGATEDENSTINSIKEKVGEKSEWKVSHVIPFSSLRKYSGVVFEGKGAVILGAKEFLNIAPNREVDGYIQTLSDAGKRVVVVALSKEYSKEYELPQNLEAVGLIVMGDRVRTNANETLKYFYEQGVDVKIISGDNAKTVSNIALQAGVKGAERYIDASEIKTDEQMQEAVLRYNVFGRVTPEQKKLMIEKLKKAGKTVAMMGDGVNDVMALKESDCSIAVASGSDAAKNIASFVILDSDFRHLPSAVLEGRKVINNIENVSTMFITKTIYSVLLALFSMFFMDIGYPFTPVQLTLIAFVTIGFPAFFLALEPNYNKISGHFLLNVFSKSLPGGLCTLGSIVIVNSVAGTMGVSDSAISTMCLYTAVIAGLWVVYRASRPLSKVRAGIIIAAIAIFVLADVFLGDFFNIAPLNLECWVIIAITGAIMPVILWLIETAIKKGVLNVAGMLKRFKIKDKK